MSARSLSTITPVATKNAPPAAASYSQAIRANSKLYIINSFQATFKTNTLMIDFVYVSGQVPFTPDGKAVEGSISEKAEQVFANLKAILEEANSGLDRAVKSKSPNFHIVGSCFFYINYFN
ncbi:hypothetical protein WICMUC_002223 [Wickerhamomyces mucosus]|uniref:Uncharacterized protein n=1 Tax=Wickerhamomyces mucosus TaxID=1378264 RepID=A0A9P8PQT8_9ASCO|nr:hypothetical protein WICMUC_002223 [Wickerhamomyces mucosus]